MLKDGKEIRNQMYAYLLNRYEGVTAPNWSVKKMLETAYTFESEERQLKELMQFTPLTKKMKILDAGCGFGHLVSLLLSKGYNCYGYEVREDLVDIARNILLANKQDSDRIIFVGQKKLPFKDETFDFINLNFVLDYVSDIPHLLKELKRILKKGGQIFIVAPNYQCCFTPIYALIFFPWLPRWLNRLYFRLNHRPNTKVIENLTFIHPRLLNGIFNKLGFSVQNWGLKHWEGLIDRINVENRNSALLAIINLAHKLKATWVIKLIARAGFYTPLVYTLTKK